MSVHFEPPSVWLRQCIALRERFSDMFLKIIVAGVIEAAGIMDISIDVEVCSAA